MSDRYAACFAGPVAPNAASTQVAVIGSRGQGRAHLYDWLFGHVGAAADNVISNTLNRFTAIPTGPAAVVPVALDMAAGTHGVTCYQNATTGTVTASSCLISIATNQRASHRWVAAPDGELVIPATDASGIYYHAGHASLATNQETTFHWTS